MKLSDIPPEEFAHFGVKGQKWGVRKKEESSKKEKSVSKEELAKREKKAEKYDIKADMYQTRLSQIQSVKPKNGFQRREQQGQIKDLTKWRDQAIKDAEAKRQGKLSKGQKQAITGAAVAAAIIATTVTYNTIQSGNGRRQLTKGENFLKDQTMQDFFKKKSDLVGPMGTDDIMSKVVGPINPNYGELGTKNNCRRATMAYEMRRRGYDVSATRTGNGRGQTSLGMYNAMSPEGQKPVGQLGSIKRLIKESSNPGDKPFTDFLQRGSGNGTNPIEKTPTHFAEKIFSSLGQHPEGARGELGVTWRMGGGHSVAWEVIGGKPVIIDTQSGKMFKTADDLNKYYGTGSIASAGFTRLDNVALNNDFLSRWVKNVKS